MAEWKDLEPTTGDWEGAPVSDEWVWNGEKPPTVTTAKEYAEKACACADKASASEQNAEDYAANANEAAAEAKELADRILGEAGDLPSRLAGIEESIEGKQDIISDLDAIRAGAALGATAIQEHQDISGKQDVITDLATIRNGARKGATALQSESDPTVPNWAKQPQKPTYTASEVGALPDTVDFVAYDGAQTLTDAQKAQARTNISALGSTEAAPLQNIIESISVDGEPQPITNKNVDIKTVFEGSGDDNPDLMVFDGQEDPAVWTKIDTVRKAVLDVTTVAPNSEYLTTTDNCSFVCKKSFLARLTAISISSFKSSSIAQCAIYLNNVEMIRAVCSSNLEGATGEASFEFPIKAGDVIQCGNPTNTGWPMNAMRIEAVGVGGSTKSFIWSINGKRTANHELEIAEVATSGSYSDLSDTPTKLSEFENDVPYVKDKLDEKTYTNVVINGTSTNGKCEHYTVGFATIAPASWSSQWKVRLRIEASILATNGSTYVSQIESTIYGYGNVNNVTYANFNSFTSSSYRPFNYLSILRPVDGSQLADYPFRLCFLGASQTNATAHYSRTIKVTLLEQVNCVCSLFDNASTTDYQTYYHDLLATVKAQAKSIGYWTYSSASSQTFNATSLNCVDYGLQETGDANSIDRLLDNYFRPYVGSSILYGYKLCMMGDDNRIYPLVTTTGNAFNKAVQTIPLRPDSIWYYSTSTQVNAGALVPASNLYRAFPYGNCKYTFNTDIAIYQTVYLCGDFDASTGLFTLETKDDDGKDSITSFYVQVPTNVALTNKATYFRAGKYYLLVGGTYSTVNYMQLFIEHPMYFFDGTNLVPVIASAVRATNDKDGNEISTTYAKLSDIPSGTVTTGTVSVAKDATTVTISHANCAAGKVATLIPMSASACTFGFYLSEMKAGSMKFTFLEPLGEAASFGWVLYG